MKTNKKLTRKIRLIFFLLALVISASVAVYALTSSPTQSCIPKLPPLHAKSSEFDYFLVYNKTNGAILSMITLQKCQEGKNVSVGGFRFDSSSLSVVPDKNQGQLNITSSPYLNLILSNGWLNAFYVTNQGELTPRPGITFSGQQAYYNGQPVTNGTIPGTNP